MSGPRATVDDLGASWFGAGLSPHALTRLRESASTRTYESGEAVMREGDLAPPFGIVSAGRVALRLLVPERGAVTILTVEPGDMVGWSAIVPPYRATSTAIAVEPTRIFQIEAPALRALLRDDPDLAATVYPRVLEALARRLGATRHQLLDLYARDPVRSA
jgi:CRP-like cAMP-binding protein